MADLVAGNNGAQDGIWKAIIADPDRFAPHEKAWRIIAAEGGASIRARLFGSGSMTLIACAIAGILGWVSGELHPSLPVHPAKTLLFVGTSLMAWATVLGLGTPASTWDGPALPERIIPKLFLVLFLPGMVMALLGSLL